VVAGKKTANDPKIRPGVGAGSRAGEIQRPAAAELRSQGRGLSPASAAAWRRTDAPRLAPLITAIGLSLALQEAVRNWYPQATSARSRLPSVSKTSILPLIPSRTIRRAGEDDFLFAIL